MSRFNISWHRIDLEPSNPFTIARGTKKVVPNVIVELTADGITGLGEAGPNKRYHEDAQKVQAYLADVDLAIFENVKGPKELTKQIDQQAIHPEIKSAKSALEMAWLDWWGKSQGKPLWQLLDLSGNTTPPTSFTIGLDSTERMQQKVKEAEGYPILKVKLGTDRDFEIIRAIRAVTDKPIRVDANEGWETVEAAKKHISFLADQNIELIEQPMPAGSDGQMQELFEWSPLSLFADERFKGSGNLEDITTMFDGINIKLAKIGSIVKAGRVISRAQELGLQVMIGCMIESSLGIAAGALLGCRADFVDLDGNLLISNDPFEGLALTSDYKVRLNDRAGLGIERS